MPVAFRPGNIDLVDDVVAYLVKNLGASKKGLSTGGSRGNYARYFTQRGLGMGVVFSPARWARLGEPLWLSVNEITETGWVYSPVLEHKIRQYLSAEPNRVTKGSEATVVALHLPIGAEREDEIDALSGFISAVADGVGTEDAPSESTARPEQTA